MHKIFFRGGQLGLLVGALASVAAMAGGLFMYEVANDNVGLANAGAAARAQNPGTLASNMAGMSYLPGTQVVRFGASPLLPRRRRLIPIPVSA